MGDIRELGSESAKEKEKMTFKMQVPRDHLVEMQVDNEEMLDGEFQHYLAFRPTSSTKIITLEADTLDELLDKYTKHLRKAFAAARVKAERDLRETLGKIETQVALQRSVINELGAK